MTSLKTCSPVSSRIGVTVVPGVEKSIISWLRPACRSRSSGGEVRHSTIAWWDLCAPPVQIFVPLTRHPPPTRSAPVRTEARSEPLSGSLIPIEKKHSPRAIAGRNRFFCSSVPWRRMLGPL
jgi:hypothetical protein